MSNYHVRCLLQDDANIFICELCGARQVITLPLPIADWLSAAEQFQKEHAHEGWEEEDDSPAGE